MSKDKSSPMTLAAAVRIASTAAVRNGGQIPAKNFAIRAIAAAQKSVVAPPPAKTAKC